MRTRPRYILATAIWVLAAVTASGIGAAFGAGIACVGDDDHIDVESLLDGCCIVAGAEIQGEDIFAAPAKSCGDCVDVQLKVSAFKSADSHLSVPEFNRGCVFCHLCGGGRHEATSADTIDRVDLHARSLSDLSKVVLLT